MTAPYVAGAHRIVDHTVHPIRAHQLLLGVHPPEHCTGRACVIHAPSTHHMSTWRLHWRYDRAMFERICPHQVGHPDPDQTAYWDLTLDADEAAVQGVHGCDGCCHEAWST